MQLVICETQCLPTFTIVAVLHPQWQTNESAKLVFAKVKPLLPK